MTTMGEIHWHEGLFLQPHHLQTMQRNLANNLANGRKLSSSYPYGLVASSVSQDALENMIVQVEQLRVIMPSGVDLQVPGTADLPSLDIREAFESTSGSFTVYVGVPLWYAKRANAVEADDDSQGLVKRIFNVSEIERPDENTGENPQPIPVRRINARLLLETDDFSDMEVLPLLKISHATGEEIGLPRRDREFIPPCMLLRGSTVLRDIVRDLANQVEASRSELNLQIGRGGFRVDNMRGIQFEQMFRLRTLNRYAAQLPQLVEAPGVTPFEIYLELRGLLGELSALYPDRNTFDAAKYDHDSPALAFHDVCNKIRSLLRGAVAPSYIMVPFEKGQDAHRAVLTDEQLTVPSEYYLGIQTAQDARAITGLVEDPDKFKMMASSLAERAIWGIKLALEHVPPLELPAEPGLIYFRLLRGESAKMWGRISDEKAISALWPGIQTSDFRLALYMTVPDAGGVS